MASPTEQIQSAAARERLPESPAAGRVSVLVPTLDEGENIDRLLDRVLAHGRARGLDLEIIVIDDGSTDGTREKVRAREDSEPVRLLARDGERGLSEAVLAGARLASGETCVIIDADLSHPPEKIAELVAPLHAGEADMVIGSRYVPGGDTPGWPRLRRLYSRGASLLARALTDVRDPMAGLMALSRERLLSAGKEAAGFKIGLEVLLRSEESTRVAEVPIVFRDRTHGESKLSGKVVGRYLWQLADLAGCAVTREGLRPFLAVLLAGLAVDLTASLVLLGRGQAGSTAQLIGFGAGTLVALLASRALGAPDRRGRFFPLFTFLTVALLALFLRGGLFGLVGRWGGPPWLAVALAALGTVAVTAPGWAFLAFPPRRAFADPGVAWRVAALGALVYLLALRLLYAIQLELLPQEAYYWNYSQHLDIGYLDHPPMLAWLIAASTALGGDREIFVRLPAILCWGLTLVLGYLFVRNAVGRAAAPRSALLLSVMPFFFGVGLLATPDAPLAASWAGMIYSLERALLGGKRRAWWGVGLFLGLGMLSKYTIVLLGGATLVFLAVDPASRRCFRSWRPYACVALSVLVFSPVILWNWRNDWASFSFQSSRRLVNDPVQFALPYFLVCVVCLATPVALEGLVSGLRGLRRGTLRARLDGRRLARFAALYTLVPMSVFLVTSFWAETKMNWTGPLWIAALPVLVLTMTGPARAEERGLLDRLVAWSWRPVLLVLMLVYGLVLYYALLGLPGVQWRQMYLTTNWMSLGEQVSAIEREVEERTGERPLVLGLDKYNLSSLLAFYDPRGEGPSRTAGRHLLERYTGLMYNYWFPRESAEGRSLVVVHRERRRLEQWRIVKWADEAEPIRELVVRKDGLEVGRYYARVLHGYSVENGERRKPKRSRRSRSAP
jgi:dolichol-phosphate mannosyltransferase